MSAATTQEFCVRWNSHLGSIGAAFPQLLAGQRFVDVTLACEGHQVHCHRLVLAACSTYFEAILAENPCKHPVIILPSEIKLWEIQALVDFMYKGELSMESDLDTSANTSGSSLMHSSIDGYTSYKRVRRSEASLAQAAKCVSKGETFQTVSNMFNIPVSTIRFYMARKGILPKRKRGRGASHAGGTITTTNSVTGGNGSATAQAAAAAAAAAATMAAATTLGSLSTAGAHHLPHHLPLDAMQLKRLTNATSGASSPTAAAAAAAALVAASSPSLEVATAAGVPFHLLSDAAAFKLSEQQQQAHII
ncbi:CG8924 [Drosophila busckii]|uniref:CG8924 n=1 Tax=Drosophila busckii TaxID=30019 RepID=A0A0M3QZ80_DROBS|nr:CG8924 [Drosophila busckii]